MKCSSEQCQDKTDWRGNRRRKGLKFRLTLSFIPPSPSMSPCLSVPCCSPTVKLPTDPSLEGQLLVYFGHLTLYSTQVANTFSFRKGKFSATIYFPLIPRQISFLVSARRSLGFSSHPSLTAVALLPSISFLIQGKVRL